MSAPNVYHVYMYTANVKFYPASDFVTIMLLILAQKLTMHEAVVTLLNL